MVVPDKRYVARCSQCLKKRRNIHSYHIRYVNDLPITESVVKLEIHYRKIICPVCGIRIEHIDFVEPYGHTTKRFAQYIASLCKVMTIRDVAQHVKFSWYQVKEIDKAHLQAHYENVPIETLSILSVDEIATKKRHHYMTVILNYKTGTILRMNIEAAIDKVKEMEVVDTDRMGVGGHSYGAFSTANLLIHTNLFRAGIARSGAYNRTLTPFGFQRERRTFWEAQNTYMAVSPFTNADKIDKPILLLHGMDDSNSGTFPIQSERLYHALRGLGGISRYVQYPFEDHGYRARETVMDVLYHMIDGFDTYVKDAPVTAN